MHEKICDRVFLVGGSGFSDSSDCLCYALDPGAPVLIDCGCGPGWTQLRQNIRSTGLDPDHLHTLILTHAHVDHIGAAPAVAADTSCTVVAHELDSEAIETGDERKTAADWYHMKLDPMTVNHKMSAHAKTLTFLETDLHLLHTPGHTPGSIIAWLDTPEGRVLFGQDIHGPFHPAFGSDKPAWRRSMKELIELEPDILCEGHFGIFRGKQNVRAFIEDHLSRHQRP